MKLSAKHRDYGGGYKMYNMFYIPQKEEKRAVETHKIYYTTCYDMFE